MKGAAESKKLVVGFDKSYPPYGFVGDDGEYTGFDLDLAKAVADKQGLSLIHISRALPEPHLAARGTERSCAVRARGCPRVDLSYAPCGPQGTCRVRPRTP